MKFLVLPDKFKGSLTAEEVIRAITRGLHKALPGAECVPVLASDGGDGFLEAIANYLPVETITHACQDPLGRPIQASYLLHRKRRQAFVELARASGLVLLKDAERTAMHTSTYGTGLQIRHAIAEGATSVYLGLGGSATNDGGTGIARALGYRFLDASGKELSGTGAALSSLAAIDDRHLSPTVKNTSFTAINDVNNPLYGPEGAAFVYAAQKVATAREIELLDRGLKTLDSVVSRQSGKSLANTAGSGAAGGTAYGLKAFFDASFISGIEFILDLAGIPELLETHTINCILTGEGKIDRQTLSGKLINGVLDLGRRYQIPVIAVCGMLDVSREALQAEGLQDVIEIRDTSKSLEYNMKHAARLLEEAVGSYFRQP